MPPDEEKVRVVSVRSGAAAAAPKKSSGKRGPLAVVAVGVVGCLMFRALSGTGEQEARRPPQPAAASGLLVYFTAATAESVPLPSPATLAGLTAAIESHQRAGGRTVDRLLVEQGRDVRIEAANLTSDSAVSALRPGDAVRVLYRAPPTGSWVLGAPEGLSQPNKSAGVACDRCDRCYKLPKTWRQISGTTSCEENDQGISRTAARWNMPSLESCFAACVDDPECVAVDWYCETKWCNLYSEACANPTDTHQGASSYAMTQRRPKHANDACPDEPRPYHVMVTASEKLNEQWATRVAYYWYRKVKAADPCGEMGGFTRLLHGKPDELMEEVPTVTVDRIQNDYGFVVLNRPNAFRQWLAKLDSGEVRIPEKYLLLIEPDHIFLKAPPNVAPAAFQFSYMRAAEGSPQWDAAKPHIPKGKSPADLPQSGPSPTLLHLDDWRRITPDWLRRSVNMQRDRRSQRAYTWVLEMWSFCAAALDVGLKINVLEHFQVEPCTVLWCASKVHKNETVWAQRRGQGPFILHLTFGQNFALDGSWWDERANGTLVPWSFNKRKYGAIYPPRDLTPPPPGASHSGAGLIVEMVNEASANIPGWGRKGMGFGVDTCDGARTFPGGSNCKHHPKTRHRERLGIADLKRARIAVDAAKARMQRSR
eukprot:TRINITY_DN7239_c3_g1_i1.p1 TRINITY_DN7239_c3_g1~~TRINITY_DN7239_c3_g1_i1.p1  ORF type:complete len:651 (+),score=197.98 TRINITY_DN7239_c3_g1_i1:102-2054(+)